MKRDDVAALLELSRDDDARVRAKALHELCPCELKVNVEAVWHRVFELAADPDAHVRRAVLHTLCDGSPRGLEARVAETIEVMQKDDDPKLRRHARKILAVYRRTGRLNIA